jgi:hypothetical protein
MIKRDGTTRERLHASATAIAGSVWAPAPITAPHNQRKLITYQ